MRARFVTHDPKGSQAAAPIRMKGGRWIKASVRQPQRSAFLMSSMASVAAAVDATGDSHDTHAFVVYTAP